MRYRVALTPSPSVGHPPASSLRACVRQATRAAARSGSTVAACAVVTPSTGGGDPMICLTLDPAMPGAASARGVVGKWERHWLLIDSTSHGRRDRARADLERLVSLAIAESAMTGSGRPDTDDVGF